MQLSKPASLFFLTSALLLALIFSSFAGTRGGAAGVAGSSGKSYNQAIDGGY